MLVRSSTPPGAKAGSAIRITIEGGKVVVVVTPPPPTAPPKPAVPSPPPLELVELENGWKVSRPMGVGAYGWGSTAFTVEPGGRKLFDSA